MSLLDTYYAPTAVPGTEDNVVNKNITVFMELVV